MNNSSSQNDWKEMRKQLLSNLHKQIRLNNWDEVRLTLEEDKCLQRDINCAEGTGGGKGQGGDYHYKYFPLILLSNSIGWAAIHFTVLHCTSANSNETKPCWRWMILHVLEDYYHYKYRGDEMNGRLFQRQGRIIKVDDVDDGTDGCDDETMFMCSPFLQRTEAGYSSIDLFFAKRLFPFPFETTSVKEDASRLLSTIKKIVSLCESESHVDVDTDTRESIVIVGDGTEARSRTSVGGEVNIDGNGNGNGHRCHDSVFERVLSTPFKIGNTISSNEHQGLQQQQQQQFSILEDLRRRIRMKIKNESKSVKSSTSIVEKKISNSKIRSNSNNVQSQVLNDSHTGGNVNVNVNVSPVRSIATSIRQQQHNNEVEEVMSSSQHVTESIQYSNQYLQEQEQQQQRSALGSMNLSQEEIQELVDFWYDLIMLVMAAVHDTIHIEYSKDGDIITVAPPAFTSSNNYYTVNRKKWRVVHALARTGCPTEIAKLAIYLYPEQITQRDEAGNLPLHIACSSHSTGSFAEGNGLSNSSSLSHHRNYSNRTIVNNNKSACLEKKQAQSSPMMKCLLDVYPQATTLPNSSQKLPITLALCAGKYWHTGVRDIFQSNPLMFLSGLSKDTETNLYSFMIAAAAAADLALSANLSSGPKVSSSTSEEMRMAQRIASKKIGSMWRFLPYISKRRALKEARAELEMMKLTTIFELLRIAPEACLLQNGK